MRFRELGTVHDELAELDGKKRLGVRQKARRTALVNQLSQVTQPPPTPRRAPTGERADFQGNVYELRRRDRFGQNSDYGRMMRRNSTSGRGGIQPFRSRIQRLTRKQRTGGVR
jgi:hypothetical protein